MTMSTCYAMKIEALAGVGGDARSGGCPVCNLASSGRGELLSAATSFRRRAANVQLRAEASAVRQERRRGSLVCRATMGGKDVYQPFRPPISVESPPLGAASTEEQIEILRERRGLWHEYAALIPVLTRAGFSPAMIDEATGMTGVEQNIVVVASQVRSSLKATGLGDEKLAYFDHGGAEVLYELRILSAQQRKASAEFALARKMSPKDANELARAVKDFDRRRNTEGFAEFTSTPGDCLALACYRQSKECTYPADAEAALLKGLDFCVTDRARAKIEAALDKTLAVSAAPDAVPESTFLQVIRLLEGEVVGTKLPTMLPVADATLASLAAVPALPPRGKGPFNIFSSTADWPSWVAIPGWDNVVAAAAPVAVIFPDPAILPLQSNKNGVPKLNEPTLVIVDKAVTEVDASDRLYVVAEGQALGIKSGSRVSDGRVLGRVVIALRPPTPESSDPIDWD